MTEPRHDVAMMFSGGLDTTLAAARMLEEDPQLRLHLLTFCNGICVRVGNSRVHVAELQARYGPERVLHRIEYVTELFAELRRPLPELVRRAGSTLVFDLCCRLSFESAAIIYCRVHGIQRLADGTNLDQGRLFLETPAYLEVTRAFFAEHGVEYVNPVYGRLDGRQGRVDQLRARGLSTGPKALERLNITSSLAHQPFCLFAFHTFFFTSFLAKTPGLRRGIAQVNLPVERAIAVRLERQEVARRLIAARTARVEAVLEQGLRIEERACTTRLCGQEAVQIDLPPGTRIDLDRLEAAWGPEVERLRQGSFLRGRFGDLSVEVDTDGRVVVSGTQERERALRAFQQRVVAPGALGVAGLA